MAVQHLLELLLIYPYRKRSSPRKGGKLCFHKLFLTTRDSEETLSENHEKVKEPCVA